HEHHVGPLPYRRLDGLRPVLGLADDLDVVLVAQDGPEPGPDQGVVVDDEHTDVVHYDPSPPMGISARTRQPVPLTGPASQLPPSAAARSRMPCSPCPPPAGKEPGRCWPSSATSMATARSPTSTRTLAWRAVEWRSTFVSPSWTMRYPA